MPNAVGFGSAPAEFGPAGLEVQEPLGDPVDQLSNDIHAIRAKYVDGGTNTKVVLQLAANAGARQDMTGQEVNSILLTVATGVIFGYLQDQSGSFGTAAVVPDFAVSAGVVPTTIQIMVPILSAYVVTFQEGAGSTATGVARIMKI